MSDVRKEVVVRLGSTRPCAFINRLQLLIATSVLAFPMLGCVTAQRPFRKGEDLRVTAIVGVVDSPREGIAAPQPPKETPLSMPEEFKAEGRGAYPANSSGGVQRIAIAEAQARRNALRALGEKILAHRPDGTISIRDLANRNPDLVSRLADFLEKDAKVEFASGPQEVVASAAAPGDGLLQKLNLKPPPTIEEKPKPAADGVGPSDASRKETLDLAMKTARKMLYGKVLETETSQGTLQELVFKDDALAGKLKSMVDQVEPETPPKFHPNGTCEVTLMLPRSRLEEVAPK